MHVDNVQISAWHARVAYPIVPSAMIIALLIGILLPALGAARRTARRMQNNTQIRGIHLGLMTFANSNKENFAGLDSAGKVLADINSLGAGDTIQRRYYILLEGDFSRPSMPSSNKALTTKMRNPA